MKYIILLKKETEELHRHLTFLLRALERSTSISLQSHRCRDDVDEVAHNVNNKDHLRLENEHTQVLTDSTSEHTSFTQPTTSPKRIPNHTTIPNSNRKNALSRRTPPNSQPTSRPIRPSNLRNPRATTTRTTHQQRLPTFRCNKRPAERRLRAQPLSFNPIVPRASTHLGLDRKTLLRIRDER
jgi:hypothetical protein